MARQPVFPLHALLSGNALACSSDSTQPWQMGPSITKALTHSWGGQQVARSQAPEDRSTSTVISSKGTEAVLTVAHSPYPPLLTSCLQSWKHAQDNMQPQDVWFAILAPL